tara:strand:+ start:1369 stop:2544 length:1176 start_codon:yes stop_codon:yes gene_type:complete
MDQSSKSNILLIEKIYNALFSSILSKDESVDAELLSNLALNILNQVSIKREWPGISWMLNCLENELSRSDIKLEQNIFGCHFKNPIGLGAGFDKNGVAASIWDRFGFGFAELGTVTWHAQDGNPKPRLFRLAAERGALNRMGFNNDGAKKMLETLKKQHLPEVTKRPAILGINFGKSKIVSLKNASDDYALSLKQLSSLADYVVINISSPNTPGLRELQDTKNLKGLIDHLKNLKNCPPLLIKIAPDLSDTEIDKLAQLAKEKNIAGIIAVNTSINRLGLENRILSQSGLPLKEESGGISGAPLRFRALEVIRRLHQNNINLPLIGVGGINSPETAWERITAGASLVQIYTGWIFDGPSLIPKILEGLICQIDRHGFRNISEAIGSEAPWI